VSGVATELAKVALDWADIGTESSRWAQRLARKLEPVASGLRPSRDVVNPPVLGTCHPERGGGAVTLDAAATLARHCAQVVLEQVVLLDTIFHKVSVTLVQKTATMH